MRLLSAECIQGCAMEQAVTYVALLVKGLLLWKMVSMTGTIENVKSFFTSLQCVYFMCDSSRLSAGSVVGGVFLVIVGVGLTVLWHIIFNMVAKLMSMRQ